MAWNFLEYTLYPVHAKLAADGMTSLKIEKLNNIKVTNK